MSDDEFTGKVLLPLPDHELSREILLPLLDSKTSGELLGALPDFELCGQILGTRRHDVEPGPDVGRVIEDFIEYDPDD